DRNTVRWLRPDTGHSEEIARGHSLVVIENHGLAAYVSATDPDDVRTSHLMRFDLVTKKSTDAGEIGETVTYSAKGDTAIYFSAARNGRLVAITAVKLTQTDRTEKIIYNGQIHDDYWDQDNRLVLHLESRVLIYDTEGLVWSSAVAFPDSSADYSHIS